MKILLKTFLMVGILHNLAFAEAVTPPSTESSINNYKTGNSAGGKLMDEMKKKDKKNDPLNIEVDGDKLRKAFAVDPELSTESYNQAKRDKVVDKIKDNMLERNLDTTIKRAECKKLKDISKVNECFKNLNK